MVAVVLTTVPLGSSLRLVDLGSIPKNGGRTSGGDQEIEIKNQRSGKRIRAMYSEEG